MALARTDLGATEDRWAAVSPDEPTEGNPGGKLEKARYPKPSPTFVQFRVTGCIFSGTVSAHSLARQGGAGIHQSQSQGSRQPPMGNHLQPHQRLKGEPVCSQDGASPAGQAATTVRQTNTKRAKGDEKALKGSESQQRYLPGVAE